MSIGEKCVVPMRMDFGRHALFTILCYHKDRERDTAYHGAVCGIGQRLSTLPKDNIQFRGIHTCCGTAEKIQNEDTISEDEKKQHLVEIAMEKRKIY